MARGSTSRSRARHAANTRWHGDDNLYLPPTPSRLCSIPLGLRVGWWKVTKIMPALTNANGWAVRIMNLRTGDGVVLSEERAIEAIALITFRSLALMKVFYLFDETKGKPLVNKFKAKEQS